MAISKILLDKSKISIVVWSLLIVSERISDQQLYLSEINMHYLIISPLPSFLHGYLLVEGDDDDEGGGHEGPAPADGGPHVEPVQVQDVDAKNMSNKS